jgi:hypothetical protein
MRGPPKVPTVQYSTTVEVFVFVCLLTLVVVHQLHGPPVWTDSSPSFRDRTGKLPIGVTTIKFYETVTTKNEVGKKIEKLATEELLGSEMVHVSAKKSVEKRAPTKRRRARLVMATKMDVQMRNAGLTGSTGDFGIRDCRGD